MHRFLEDTTLMSFLGATCFSACLLGCHQPIAEESGLSYAEALSIYNSELQALDRLEQKRESLISKHDTAMRPSTADAAKVLDTLLSSADEASKPLDQEGVTDPNALLDQAVARAEKTQAAASEILESLGEASQPREEEIQKQAELTQQFERDLAEIDAQIAEQKARVQRAREARDAAEADQE